MAVLREHLRREQVARHYPFERFEERALLFLDSLVRPGGLLVIQNSSYRFSDTANRSHYEPIPVTAPYNTVYLADGMTEAKPDGPIFRKLQPDLPAIVLEARPGGRLALGLELNVA